MITLTKKDRSLYGGISLPASKSISNRVLILRELMPSPFRIDHLSEADDSVLMQGILKKIDKADNLNNTSELNCHNAGTVFRFLTAFLAQKSGKWLLTGSERMKERPIDILVDALMDLGAEIKYAGKNGFPPLLIKGKNLSGGIVNIDSRVSSQYISALLMIAPVLKDGIELNLKGKISSEPYIRMTLGLLKYFGIEYRRSGGKIRIDRQNFHPQDIRIETDWSAASFWYELVALSGMGEIHLKGLYPSALQGDYILPEIFRQLGVHTSREKDGIIISKKGQIVEDFEFDFTHHPDLAQPVIVTCAALNIRGLFKGIHSLKIKETNRIEALMNELKKLGIDLELASNSELRLKGSNINVEQGLRIKTYGDHRMAMSFAPVALKTGSIQIEEPEVVSKSYPRFWQDMGRVGFNLILEDQNNTHKF